MLPKPISITIPGISFPSELRIALVLNSIQVTETEIDNLVDNYDDASYLATNGVTLDGVTFVYQSSDGVTLWATRSSGGVHVYKTNLRE